MTAGTDHDSAQQLQAERRINSSLARQYAPALSRRFFPSFVITFPSRKHWRMFILHVHPHRTLHRRLRREG